MEQVWDVGKKHRDARAVSSLLPPESALLNSPGWGGYLNEASNYFTALLPLVQESGTENPGYCVWHPNSCCILSFLPQHSSWETLPFLQVFLSSKLLAALSNYSSILLLWEAMSSLSSRVHSVCHQIVSIWVGIALNPTSVNFKLLSFCIHRRAGMKTLRSYLCV